MIASMRASGVDLPSSQAKKTRIREERKMEEEAPKKIGNFDSRK